MSEVIKLPVSAPLAKPGVCEIKAFRDLKDMFVTCQRQGQIGVAVGPTGCGKTTAAKTFAKQGYPLFYFRLTTIANTAQPFLVKLCSAISAWAAPNSSKTELFDAACDRLGRAWQPLLIIDEMNHASPEIVHVIRELWDETKVGIALVGTPEMEAIWAERAGRKAGKGDPFAAFRERPGHRLELKKPDTDDVDTLCRHMDLKGKRERDLIAKHVLARGGLHRLEQLLVNARGLAGDGNAVTVEHLFDAASLMEPVK